jgi:hypothetical protein
MNINRRLLLQIPVVLASPLSARPGTAAQLSPAPSRRSPDLSGCITTLAGYVDTLLPEHGDSPSASSLGIPERLLEMARRRPPYARLMSAGCDWLNTESRSRAAKDFVDLDEKEREAIVATAETSDRRGVPAQFFFNTHRHAMELFYTHPNAWPSLDYPGPPQPLGFPDYARPPSAGSA